MTRALKCQSWTTNLSSFSLTTRGRTMFYNWAHPKLIRAHRPGATHSVSPKTVVTKRGSHTRLGRGWTLPWARPARLTRRRSSSRWCNRRRLGQEWLRGRYLSSMSGSSHSVLSKGSVVWPQLIKVSHGPFPKWLKRSAKMEMDCLSLSRKEVHLFQEFKSLVAVHNKFLANHPLKILCLIKAAHPSFCIKIN